MAFGSWQPRVSVSEDSAGEMKFKRGALWFDLEPGSSFEEDDEDQVERPRSRSALRNPYRGYSILCRP